VEELFKEAHVPIAPPTLQFLVLLQYLYHAAQQMVTAAIHHVQVATQLLAA
jgi:hypothetical protein